MKKIIKRSAQHLAFILSAILITSSLTGSVLGAQIPTDTTETVVVESEDLLEESEDVNNAEAVSEESEETLKEESAFEDKAEPGMTADSEDSSDAASTDQPSDSEETEENVQTSNDAEEITEDNSENDTEVPANEEHSADGADTDTAAKEITEDVQNGTNAIPDNTQQNTGNVIEAAPKEEIIKTDSQNSAASDFTIVNGTLTKYNGTGGDVIVPGTVKVIGKEAFSGCTSITSVTLPNSTTIIAEEAFYDCSNLTRVTLPAVKKIENSAFSYCHSLSSISLPNSLTSIGYSAFYECTSIKSIIIPNGITTIPDDIFGYCSSLTSVSIPSSVKEIEGLAFEYCTSLKNITIPKDVEYLGYGVFLNCSNLSSITIPNKIEGISGALFKGCSTLKSIVLPTGIKYIWEEAFADCSSLTSITIPASVNEIEDHIVDGSYNAVIHCPSNAKYVINYAKEWEIPYKTFAILAKKITLSKSSLTVGTGRSTTIKATVSPSTVTNKAVTWKSSNAKVAKVNSAGKITGIYKGTATITATAKDGSGVKANCTVTVLLPKPGNCRFTKWNNSKYNSCKISWNKVTGADGYQTLLCWTNGSHATTKIVKAGVLSQNCSVAVNHVSQFKVRAFYNTKSGRKYGAWSNIAFITPSPTNLKKDVWEYTNPPIVEINWNIIYGCNGYNVFLTTNPNGKWYWNQSTDQYADETRAYINKYRGSKLKKGKRYYVRIVTRRKQKGVFCTVPMPASNTYIGSFVVK